MDVDTGEATPKVWRERFFEDMEVGGVYQDGLGKTVTETHNQWFTTLAINTNQVHFNKGSPGAPCSDSGSSARPSQFR